VRMDTESAEERYQLEPVDHLRAETIFDARWAMTVLGEAMSRLRWAYAAGEKTSTLEMLESFLDPINDRELPSYEQVASQLQISLSTVKTLIHRLRMQYTSILRRRLVERCQIRQKSTTRSIRFAKPWLHPKDG
jgi:hypothetical protein